jgi:hypothetical protein
MRRAAAELLVRPVWALALDEDVVRVARRDPDALLDVAERLDGERAPAAEREARRVIHALWRPRCRAGRCRWTN